MVKIFRAQQDSGNPPKRPHSSPQSKPAKGNQIKILYLFHTFSKCNICSRRSEEGRQQRRQEERAGGPVTAAVQPGRVLPGAECRSGKFNSFITNVIIPNEPCLSLGKVSITILLIDYTFLSPFHTIFPAIVRLSNHSFCSKTGKSHLRNNGQ